MTTQKCSAKYSHKVSNNMQILMRQFAESCMLITLKMDTPIGKHIFESYLMLEIILYN